MKRLFSVIILALAMTCVTAKSFFSDRFFEIRTSVPVSFTNNTIPFDNIFTRDLVLDFNDLAKKVPKNGFVLTADVNPTFGFNLRVLNVFVGFNTGLEVYERFTMSDDLFEFLGKGNEIGEKMNVSVQNNLDAFLDFNFDVGLDFKRYNLHVKPTFFIPVVSNTGKAADLSFVNDEEGNVKLRLNTDMELYSAVDFNDVASTLTPGIASNMGFDIGGSFRFPLMNRMELEVAGRIPLVPGNLPYMNNVKYDMDYELSFTDFSNAEMEQKSDIESSKIGKHYINRPMKIDGYVEYCPMGFLVTLRGGLGFGIFHPFMSDAIFYPEYYLGGNINLGNIIKAGISTEYTDRVFKNQLGMTLNLRIFQIDAGISLQAANLEKSFSGSGYGGYVVLSAGF